MEGGDKEARGKLFLIDESDYNTVEIFFDQSVDQ